MRTFKFLPVCCFLIFALLFSSTGCEQKNEGSSGASSRKLRVYNWSNYIGRLTVSQFETELGAEVAYSTYSSNEELIQNLGSSDTKYDVIFPSDNAVSGLIQEGQLQKLDKSKLTNLKFIDSKFQNLPFDPENTYCVPYNWGTTGIAVNVDKVTKPIKGWDALWDETFKGRISMLNEPRAGVLPALKRLGYSVNTTNAEELEKAKALLFEQKPLVKAYTSDRYLEFLKSTEVWLAVGYSGDIIRLAAEKPSIRYVIPSEGTDIWVDNICIPKGATNAALAHEFINYLLRPGVAADITNDTGFATANGEAKKNIRPNILNDPSVFPPPDILAKTEYARGLGDAISLYEDVWAELLRAGSR